ncbi:MAG TPA: DUF4397 domain-containing protein [Chloroflexia bacterium]|nr:DUF4397 domain-containing protein [Chloroflexia bacterium]
MKTRSLLFALLLGLCLAGGMVRASHAAEVAFVRVVHASPDAPAVDVWVDGSKVLTNVPYFTASDYLSLPAGEHQFVVTPTGQAADKAVINASATLVAGKAYTVAATGLVANLQPTILMDNLAAPAAGKAHVRVIHASPDAPAVDIAVKDGPVLISNLAFPKDSGYLPVDAGTYNLVVLAAGTKTVALDLAGVKLDAGKIYDVFAVGELNKGTLRVEVATPAPQGEVMVTGMPATGTPALPMMLALLALLALGATGTGLMLHRQAR